MKPQNPANKSNKGKIIGATAAGAVIGTGSAVAYNIFAGDEGAPVTQPEGEDIVDIIDEEEELGELAEIEIEEENTPAVTHHSHHTHTQPQEPEELTTEDIDNIQINIHDKTDADKEEIAQLNNGGMHPISGNESNELIEVEVPSINDGLADNDPAEDVLNILDTEEGESLAVVSDEEFDPLAAPLAEEHLSSTDPEIDPLFPDELG